MTFHIVEPADPGPVNRDDAPRFCQGGSKGLESYTLANVMMALNFTRSEIREILKKYTSDKLMWRLIGSDDERSGLTTQENAILEMMRALVAKNADIYKTVCRMLESIAGAYSMDLSDQARRILSTGAKKGRKGGAKKEE